MHRNTRPFQNKFRELLLVACCLLLAGSCKTEDNPPIAPEKMQPILMDIHLAEAYSTIIVTDSVQKRMINKNADSLALYYKSIFNKYGISAQQFDEAMQWYALHPQRLDSIYGKILPALEGLKGSPLPSSK